MLQKTRAVVLSTVKYSDDKAIVTLLSADLGRIAAAVSLPKSRRAAVKRQCFEPLTIVEAELNMPSRNALPRIKSVEIAVPYLTISQDMRKISIVLFLSEFLLNVTRVEAVDRNFYDFVETGLGFLDTLSRDFANFHIVFMIQLTKFLGIMPYWEKYHKGDFFDLQNGCFTSLHPLHGDFLQPQEAEKIALFVRLNFVTMHVLRLSREQRSDVTAVVLRFYRAHFPEFKDLKSLDVVKEMFD